MSITNPVEIPNWSEVRRVLVIMAHPDDPDFTCGGTMIKMAQAGIEITYMILTNGDKGNHNPELIREELIRLRKKEQLEAAAAEGVQNVLFMGEEDGFLRPTRELRKRVVREIRRIRPELIVCMHPERYVVGSGYINHPDHRNAGLVALEAVFPASDNIMFFPELIDEGYPPHKIRQLYIVGGTEPTLEIDITDVIDRKIDALLNHVTQFRNPNESKKQWLARWEEKQDDGTVRYCERFQVMKFG